MTSKQHRFGMAMNKRTGLGASAALGFFAICAVPGQAQSPAAIPGALAPGSAVELVQEG
ncbi:MAG: hypothetical protein QOF91_3634, partial [Alphaproteobacteria bacterium]|nr:hypothetical protein [Alphaproteobacteria bacterium]